MSPGLPPGPRVWLVILAAGVGTFLFRASFLFLFERFGGVPPRLERALRYVPAAVLAALVVPALVAPDGTPVLLGNDRLLAGALAALVAWRTESVLATIAVGLVALTALVAVGPVV
ncbi:MAG: AzlD domain-containing protein [Haloglomus sp.]